MDVDYVTAYCEHGAKKLQALVDGILYKNQSTCMALGISPMDYDDAYSIAAEVLWDVSLKYDGSCPFEVLLYSAVRNKIFSYFTYRNREKRMCHVNEDGKEVAAPPVSLYIVLKEEEEVTLADVLDSGYNLENDILSSDDEIENPKILSYLNKLSKTQRKILMYLADGYKPHEIQKMLNISAKSYADNLKAIRSYENISILI